MRQRQTRSRQKGNVQINNEISLGRSGQVERKILVTIKYKSHQASYEETSSSDLNYQNVRNTSFSTPDHTPQANKVKKTQNYSSKSPKKAKGQIRGLGAYEFNNELMEAGRYGMSTPMETQSKENSNKSIRHDTSISIDSDDPYFDSLEEELERILASPPSCKDLLTPPSTFPPNTENFSTPTSASNPNTQDPKLSKIVVLPIPQKKSKGPDPVVSSNLTSKSTSITSEKSRKDLRQIPKNLLMWLSSGQDVDDDEIIEDSYIVPLKDPLSNRNIKLPVKSYKCNHLQCFDYDTFCAYNKISFDVSQKHRRFLFEKGLYQRKVEKIKQEKGKIRQETKSFDINDILVGNRKQISVSNYLNFKPAAKPVLIASSFKCPVCDSSLQLADLVISDLCNYFIKTSPSNTISVEIFQDNKFRMLSDTSNIVDMGEVIEIEDLEEDDPASPKTTSTSINLKKSQSLFTQQFQLDFSGCGTSDNPVYID